MLLILCFLHCDGIFGRHNWNDIRWKDPYSAHLFSERQSIYGKRFDLDSVYTPQMVVDGSSEFVGSNRAFADKALAKALGAPKISVNLTLISANASFPFGNAA